MLGNRVVALVRGSLHKRRRVGPLVLNPLLVVGVLIYVVVAASGSLAFERGSVAQQVGDLFWFALLCGIAALATIEVLKRIFQLRGRLQRVETRYWLIKRTGGDGGLEGSVELFEELLEAMGLSKEREARDAVLRVFHLWGEQLAAPLSAAQTSAAIEAIEGLSKAERERRDAVLRFFNLPAEQPTAQVSWAQISAGHEAVDGLYKAERDARDAVLRVFDLPAEQLAAQLSAAADVALSAPCQYPRLIAGLAGLPSGQDQSAPYEESDIVAQRVQEGVDQLQIHLGKRWRRHVQSAALFISGGFGILLTRAGLAGTEAHDLLAVLLFIGGVLALPDEP